MGKPVGVRVSPVALARARSRSVETRARPRGAQTRLDNGATWAALDARSHWAVGFANPSAGGLSVQSGRITKISLY